MEINDTRMIPLGDTVDAGYIKNLDESTPYIDTSSQVQIQDADSTLPYEEPYFENLPYPSRRSPSLWDWISAQAVAFPKSLLMAIAVNLNIARLSSDNLLTGPLDETAIIKLVAHEQSILVSVSPELLMPRDQVKASSLVAPSGASLTWLEMLGEYRDDHSQ